MNTEQVESSVRWRAELLPSILVVEDDPAHAEAITRALDLLMARYRVRLARSMHEANLALSAESPALVLADLHLSDGSALDMLPDAREHARFPLLVLTSQGDERTAVQSIRAGALDYVVKSPDALAELPRTVERALREWRLRQERLRAERALRESEERFRVLFDSAPDALLIYEPDGRVLDANRAAERLFGRSRHELVSSRVDALGFTAQSTEPSARGLLRESSQQEPVTLWVMTASGERRDVELRTVSVQLSGRPVLLATVQDISARLHAEQAKRRLEEQLHHALKLDALGRLAGGVAHDFNNLLTAIAGYAELMLRGGADISEYPSALQEILNASQRAAGLTSQLLAFSRKQVIEPVVLDLNALLENATRMIQRLIGEDISLVFEPAEPLHLVKVDRNQIEQVMINLAVNARDAMPDGGTLRVSTQNVSLRETERQELLDADVAAGEYVVLEVADTGAGMDEETQARLFEPFFTTKARGRGTGLGLSIIYGAVKQNGGFVSVRSELGTGTCFSIYLPRVEGVLEDFAVNELAVVSSRGAETILLVEDEPAVRDVVGRFLQNAGYHVLARGDARAAIALMERPEVTVDLLLTDVVLPGMNGKQLHQHLCAMRPGLRVLFMSGYTDDVIAKHGLVDPSIALLEKPLTQAALLRAVRSVLDGLPLRAP
jgi:two-component system, cell cycle sensor histidine kinase and response regulator CckA